MEIKFLPSALDDLVWMKEYYEVVFPDGKTSAGANFESTLVALRDNPKIGTVVETVPMARRFPIKKTPFSIIYRIQDGEIQILRVRDQRSIKRDQLNM